MKEPQILLLLENSLRKHKEIGVINKLRYVSKEELVKNVWEVDKKPT